MRTGSIRKSTFRASPRWPSAEDGRALLRDDRRTGGPAQGLPEHDPRTRATAGDAASARAVLANSAHARSDGDVIRGNKYDKYGTANPVERRLMDGFFAALARALPPTVDGPILEVGIGEGQVAAWVTKRYPGVAVTGLDLPDEHLASHWSGRRIPACFGDIAALPFPDRRFGLVLAIEVLEHVPDPATALAEIVRVGRGHVVVSVPREPLWRVANMARGKYLSTLGNTPGHVQHWSRRSFVALVGKHLELLGVQSPPPWTMVSARVRA